MNFITISLLMIAYSLGLATLILQILCYIKKIELKETIIFSVSFLLLVLWATISEIIQVFRDQQEINKLIFAILTIILGVTTPVNVHAERQIKNPKPRNRAVEFIGLVLLVTTIPGYIMGFIQPVYYAVIAFLNASILYSMILIIRTKPTFAIKHRDKIEKRTAVFIIAIMLVLSAVGITIYGKQFLNEIILNGSVILALICIVLCVFKITDDLQRLALISNAKKFSLDHLEEHQITRREKEVIMLLVSGMSYKTIADKLFISIPTVKTHASNIYQKLNVKNKIELINLLNAKME